MLAKTNSNRSRWKYLLALPLLFLAFYGTSLAQKGEPVDFETELDAVPQPTNLGEIRKRIGYPEAAIEKNVTGKVIVRLLVNKDGTVDQAEILKSPSLILSTAVGKHIEDLTFTPGKKDEKTVKTQVMIPFQFKLDPNDKKACDAAVPEAGKVVRMAGASEYLRVQAISRLFLDNIHSIGSSWVTMGPKIGQLALYYGANDMGSVMMEENVVSAAGTTYCLSEEVLCHLIRDAGFTPAQRDNRYDFLAVHNGPDAPDRRVED